MQETLLMPSRKGLQEKKNQLQCDNHMNPKKNCNFVNKINWNMLCIRENRSVFQNDSLEMSFSVDAYTS